MKKSSFILLLMPLVILGPLAVDIFLPALPAMATSLDASPTHIQWTITAYMFSLGLGQLLFGPISDKVGRKPVLLFGLVAYCVTAILVAMINDYVLHIVFRALQGIGACAIVVATFASVTDKFNSQESAKVYSYLHGIIFCIPALAPILGYHLSREFGWQSNFLFMACIGVLVLLIMVFGFRETKTNVNSASPYLPKLAAYGQVVTNKDFIFYALMVMLAMATIMAFVSTAPNVFVLHYGLGEDVFTFWFSINAGVTIVVSFLAGKLLAKYGAKQIIVLAMLIVIASGVALLAFSSADILSYILPVILGTTGLALLMGAAIAQALAPFKQQAGLAAAILGFIQMSGSAALVTWLQVMALDSILQVALFSLSFIPLLLLKIGRFKALRAKPAVS